MARVTDQVDPITTEVIRQAFVAASDEMKINLTRTSYNPIIYEVLDFSVGLFNSAGELISQAAGLPFFLGNMAEAVRVVQADAEAEGFVPGDVYLINDTYTAGTHLNDVTAITPVFVDDRLVGFTASRAHWIDIGARDPGGWLSDTTEIYQEGLRLRSVRLYEGGKLNASIQRLLEDNVRYDASVMGDLRAQVAAGRTGEQRFAEIVEKWGLEIVERAVAASFARAEARTRAAIEAIPNGVYHASAFLDDDGVAVDRPAIEVSVSVTDDALTIDLTGSESVCVGPTNCGYAATISACRVALKAITDPLEEVNEGTFAPLHVSVPADCMFNAQRPAPAGVYGIPMITLCDTIWKALAPALPDLVPSGHFADLGTLFLYGEHGRDGKPWIHAEPQGGGWGAGPHGDGENMLICIADGDTRNVPVEIIESKYPLRVERYALRKGSGGAGACRGGLGQFRDYRVLDPTTRMTAATERTLCPPWGLHGGREGATGEFVLNPGREDERKLKKASGLGLAENDLVSSRTGGGGGWGNPAERPAAAIEEDLAAGYISTDAASDEYGYRASS